MFESEKVFLAFLVDLDIREEMDISLIKDQEIDLSEPFEYERE